ncbi:MAG TPA: hypothetical protein VGR57_17160 [Ktedonobacterales bacterium]|nr:hypothetical protein [Ktedonobacterales bacterium]
MADGQPPEMATEQHAFLARARARLRELEALRAEAQQALTADDYEVVAGELLLRLDDTHAAMIRVLRGQHATLNARPGTRYTIYQLDVPGGRWLRMLTARDLPAALARLIELQQSGEIAHFVAWQTLSDRAAQEQDATRFRPPLAVVDARDHTIRL